MEIVVGSAPQSMDDERFIELTRELLRADPRYHRTMLEIVSAVDRQTTRGEGLAERPRNLLVDGESDFARALRTDATDGAERELY